MSRAAATGAADRPAAETLKVELKFIAYYKFPQTAV